MDRKYLVRTWHIIGPWGWTVGGGASSLAWFSTVRTQAFSPDSESSPPHPHVLSKSLDASGQDQVCVLELEMWVREQ